MQPVTDCRASSAAAGGCKSSQCTRCSHAEPAHGTPSSNSVEVTAPSNTTKPHLYQYEGLHRFETRSRLARDSLTLQKTHDQHHAPRNGSLYFSACGTILPRMKNWGLIDRRFHGRSQTECQRGSSGPLTCKARTVARAAEPAFRKAGHDRRLR